MPEGTRKPSAIIFGGLNTCSRGLAAFLVPVDGESLVSHLCIVDKFSVVPATTYIGAEFPKVLAKPQVEYKQANLTVQSIVTSSFDPPEGQPPYDYVFDFTGEIRHDRTDVIQISTTCNVARFIGLEAAKRNVKAYVRIQQPFYDTSGSKKGSEREGIEPSGTIGTWWHEALRMLAAIPDLNLVILRLGFLYGPYTNFGIVASAITVGSVYGHLKKPVKSLWSPGKNFNNTVHIDDVAGAAWACAQWMTGLGRQAANTRVGEEIGFHNDKKRVKEVEGMPPHDQKLIAPLFNLVDDSQTTHLSMGNTISSFFGTTLEFVSFFEQAYIKSFKLQRGDVEDINEEHVSAWSEMLQNAKPPIPASPLSAYMDEYQLAKHHILFDNAKIKEIVGYKLRRPLFDHDTIKEIIDKWKEEGNWPNFE